MSYADANGIVFLQDTDPVDTLHATINQIPTSVSNWINSKVAIRRAADAAARSALAVQFPPSSAAPLYVSQDDTGALWRNIGSGWVEVDVTAGRKITPVANETAQNALSSQSSSTNPMYVFRQDTGDTRVNYSGTNAGWTTLTRATDVGLAKMTGNALAGATPPDGTVLKEIIVNGQTSSGGAGRWAVSFGYTFPNGVVSCMPILVNGDVYGASINLYGPPTLSGCTLQVISGTSAVPNINPRYSLVVKGW